ncbi:hypothetical protein E2C01_017805 [Portunus trituberculatus]|uniref:Uncharacterized protein n=1 Tax=Portunus trituberculatus TaxID=210409 RepID=A0A5B7DUU3_PORTR|nr:hypothetical protein [Portunus trituberculatus]
MQEAMAALLVLPKLDGAWSLTYPLDRTNTKILLHDFPRQGAARDDHQHNDMNDRMTQGDDTHHAISKVNQPLHTTIHSASEQSLREAVSSGKQHLTNTQLLAAAGGGCSGKVGCSKQHDISVSTTLNLRAVQCPLTTLL